MTTTMDLMLLTLPCQNTVLVMICVTELNAVEMATKSSWR